ncbi:MAG TPA: hypothetical protein VFG20_17930, partial [Planctomycetaceae bacterium]|nr:hypothetical protein [Planctomycetaceae bacterium]
MPGIRPLLLLVGLIGGGSFLFGISSSAVPVRLTTNSLPSLSDDDAVCVAEIAVHAGASRVVLDEEDSVETVLSITSQERPRHQSQLTLWLDDSGDGSRTPLIWQAVPNSAAVPDLPALRVDSPSFAFVDDTAPSTVRESWLLPSSACPAERSVAIQTTEILTTTRVRIVVDQHVANDGLLLERCRQLAVRVGTVLMPPVEATFGPVADRSDNGTLTVVVTPQVRQMVGGNKPVEAFVLASDFRSDLTRPASNECDVIYIHPELLRKPSDAVLVHELVHAAQFCAFRRHYGSSPWPLADWMLEGSAHAAEVLLTGSDDNVRDRLQAFAACPEKSPLIVMDTTREGLWREPRSRGATCSFFSWMGRQYGLRAMGQIVASGANDRWRPA